MIYICIPAHDEATTIGVLLWKTRKVLGEFGRDYRVVVHDDASTDGTLDVLERYRRALPLTVLRTETRLGYGRSVEILLRHVADESTYPKRDAVVVLQGDFTESPQDVVTLVKVLEGGADIVAGCVAANGAAGPRGVKVARWVAGLVLRSVVRRAPVSDPLSGMRAYRVIVLKKVLREQPAERPLIRTDGWAANVELLGLLAPHARRIAETPLALRYDLQARPSRFRPVKTLMSLARLPGSVWSQSATEVA